MKHTVESTKEGFYANGTCRLGSGPTKILILGSCRIMPYVNYIDFLNRDNRITLDVINIVNFNWDADNKPVDRDEAVKNKESNPTLLQRIRETQIFIHEHAEHYDFLNTDHSCPKNIYQFGMNPRADIAIPNWNAPFLFQDQLDLIPAFRVQFEEAKEMTPELESAMASYGNVTVSKFLWHCEESTFPELNEIIRPSWKKTRYWWTANHVSAAYFNLVWDLLNDRFLELPSLPGFSALRSEDPFGANPTRITEYDRKAFGLEWPQPTEPLKL